MDRLVKVYESTFQYWRQLDVHVEELQHLSHSLVEIERSIQAAVQEIQRLEQVLVTHSQLPPPSNKPNKKQQQQPELGFKREQLDDFFKD
jgi:hypothetical protein